MSENTTQAGATVMVETGDLPLHCPGPKTPLWNSHPRVFLPIEAKGEAHCPYCGTHYRLADPGAGKRHH
jgi:uncharacterized Zn-finger protein